MALAMTQLLAPDCQDSSFVCTASRALPWLYWIAGVLGFVLIAVIVLAVRFWRRNKDSDETR
jgi:uncharacterized membrane protein YdcZ (DUF606 family)